MSGKEVLKDMAKFCRAYTSTFHPDARVHALLQGRKEVWDRIAGHMYLDQEEFLEEHGRKDPLLEGN